MTDPADIVLARHIRRMALDQPDLDVLTFIDLLPDGRYAEELRTFGQLWENGQRLARRLRAAGMQRGDRFALIMQNHAEFADFMVAASITDTVFVPIDPRSAGDTLSYMLSHAECRGAVVADYAAANLAAELGDLPTLAWVWQLGSIAPDLDSVAMAAVDALLDEAGEELPIEANDPDGCMQLMFTSGTTGRPKAIASPHNRMAVAKMLPGLFGLTADDRPYTGLSLTHANAQLITLGMSLYGGLRCVISRRFSKSRLWDITRDYGCTVFNLLGGMTTAIYGQPPRSDDADNPVRLVVSGGMPKALWQSFEQRFGLQVFEIYGAAEGGMTFNPPGVGPVGSVGKPPPSLEMRIADENDNEVATGEPGEILFRNADGSPLVVNYLNNPEATREKTRDGWLRMGDVGYVDDEGWLYFLFRAGGGIRRNGEFVDPAPIEKLIAELDAIDDVYVYGVPTPANAPGEKEIVAAVVAAEPNGFCAGPVFEKCRSGLSANHVPAYVQVVPEIPKTASEKPLERRLADAFAVDADNVHQIAG